MLFVAEVRLIEAIQSTVQNYSSFLLFLSIMGDPRHSFAFFFPLSFAISPPLGIAVLWAATISEGTNQVMKW